MLKVDRLSNKHIEVQNALNSDEYLHRFHPGQVHRDHLSVQVSRVILVHLHDLYALDPTVQQQQYVLSSGSMQVTNKQINTSSINACTCSVTFSKLFSTFDILNFHRALCDFCLPAQFLVTVNQTQRKYLSTGREIYKQESPSRNIFIRI